jgi:hypothetical protein
MKRTCTALLACALLVGSAACNETVEVGANNGDVNNNDAANNSGGDNAANNDDVNNVTANNAANNDDVNNVAANNDDVNNAGNNEAGCDQDAACDQGQICDQGECVEGCRDNTGCSDGTICVEEACTQGCRDDAGCGTGQICVEEACAQGCRQDEACEMGQICVEESCTQGCRDDAGCEVGQICVEGTCAQGCRDDEGCGQGQLCLDQACQAQGVACRQDSDCNQGDVCNQAQLCEAGQAPCEADALEPNDVDAATLEPGTLSNLSICPGDVDRFQITASQEDTLALSVRFTGANGALEAALYRGQEELVAAQSDDQGASLSWVADADGVYTLVVRGADAQTRNSYALSLTRAAPQTCVDTTLYADVDSDGYGDAEASQVQCLEPDQAVEGLVSRAGDCGPQDAWRNPDGYEVCGDNVDDDCDGVDMDCPASQPSVSPPGWDCQGEAPGNVYAWARFEDGNGYFADNGCFVFFEGQPGEFYVEHNMQRSNPDCANSPNGCTCPSLNGWSSYDRRLYAFTLQGDTESCPDVSLRDHAGEDQVVSNACRKYLYQMHYYDIPYSFVAGSQAAMDARIDAFPTVEVACAEDAPHANLPYATLLTGQIVRNPNYQPAQ